MERNQKSCCRQLTSKTIVQTEPAEQNFILIEAPER